MLEGEDLSSSYIVQGPEDFFSIGNNKQKEDMLNRIEKNRLLVF